MKYNEVWSLIFLIFNFNAIISINNQCSYNQYNGNGKINYLFKIIIQNGTCFIDSLTCCSKFSSEFFKNNTNLQNHPFNSLNNWLLEESLDIQSYFKSLLNKSKNDIHSWMLTTFDQLYLHNSHIFFNLWNDIENYHIHKTIDLASSFQIFFAKLAEKFFFIMHPDANIDNISNEEFFECLFNICLRWSPFGMVPIELSEKVKNSLNAANLSAFSMEKFKLIINSLTKKDLLKNCDIKESLLCGVCNEPAILHMCPSCQQHFHSCLNNLIISLQQLIDEMLVLLNIVIGPLNINLFDSSINLFISKAIKNFKSESQFFIDKVNRHCTSSPINNRKKRRTFQSNINYTKIFNSNLDFSKSILSLKSRTVRENGLSYERNEGNSEQDGSKFKEEKYKIMEYNVPMIYKSKLIEIRNYSKFIVINICKNFSLLNEYCWNSTHWIQGNLSMDFKGKSEHNITFVNDLYEMKKLTEKLKQFLHSTNLNSFQKLDDEDYSSGSGEIIEEDPLIDHSNDYIDEKDHEILEQTNNLQDFMIDDMTTILLQQSHSLACIPFFKFYIVYLFFYFIFL